MVGTALNAAECEASVSDPDWDSVLSYLPLDWEESARELKAFTRSRSFASPELLLRTLFLHLGQGCSLRETAIRAKRANFADVSDVAILKRLRASEAWLQHLAFGLLEKVATSCGRFNVYAVDATTVSEPGSTGSDWRVHYMLSLTSLMCKHFELTDTHIAESFLRFSVGPNDLLIGDRGYENTTAIHSVTEKGGDVLVRVRVHECPLRTSTGEPFDLLSAASGMEEHEQRAWPVQIRNKQGLTVSGRICVYRRDAEATRVAERKVRRTSAHKQYEIKPETIEAAKYVAIFTTTNEEDLPLAVVFELYRIRWQIELAFKRLKTLTGFGHLPKYDAASCRAWLYGKLLVGLLAESMSRIPFSP